MDTLNDLFSAIILLIILVESIIFIIFIIINYKKIIEGDITFIPVLLLFIAIPSVLTFIKSFCEGMGG